MWETIFNLTISFLKIYFVSDLRDAINRRNLEALNKAIQEAEESVHVTRLEKLLTQAKFEREELLQLNQYTHAVLEMKQTTLSELVSYNKPLPVIHDVLVATLLLLGDNMETLQVRQVLPDENYNRIITSRWRYLTLSLLKRISYYNYFVLYNHMCFALYVCDLHDIILNFYCSFKSANCNNTSNTIFVKPVNSSS